MAPIMVCPYIVCVHASCDGMIVCVCACLSLRLCLKLLPQAEGAHSLPVVGAATHRCIGSSQGSLPLAAWLGLGP